MVPMFLLRGASIPQEATRSPTYVVGIVRAAVNKALADIKWTPRHGVRAPTGVTSTSVIRGRGRREIGELQAALFSYQGGLILYEQVGKWKFYTHAQAVSCLSHTSSCCTIMLLKAVCVCESLQREEQPGRCSINSPQWVTFKTQLHTVCMNTLRYPKVQSHVINSVIKKL